MKFKKNNGVYAGDSFIPSGTITGKCAKAKTNIGRKPTNAEFAKEQGISKRQASVKRRGY